MFKREYNMTKEQVDENFREPSEKSVFATPFDNTSVMNIYLPPELFVEGDKSRCYAMKASKLSLRNNSGVYVNYP